MDPLGADNWVMKNGYINIIHDPVVNRYVINPTYIMDVYRLFGVLSCSMVYYHK